MTINSDTPLCGAVLRDRLHDERDIFYWGVVPSVGDEMETNLKNPVPCAEIGTMELLLR